MKITIEFNGEKPLHGTCYRIFVDKDAVAESFGEDISIDAAIGSAIRIDTAFVGYDKPPKPDVFYDNLNKKPTQAIPHIADPPKPSGPGAAVSKITGATIEKAAPRLSKEILLKREYAENRRRKEQGLPPLKNSSEASSG